MPRLQLPEPRLFDPPPASYESITVRFDLHLHGPSSRAEVWTTVTDPRGDQVACYGPARARLDLTDLAAVVEILQDAIRAAASDLSPF